MLSFMLMPAYRKLLVRRRASRFTGSLRHAPSSPAERAVRGLLRKSRPAVQRKIVWIMVVTPTAARMMKVDTGRQIRKAETSSSSGKASSPSMQHTLLSGRLP